MIDAGTFKDLATGVGIVIAGLWAIWRFVYQDWLRRRSEVPSLEGSSAEPPVCAVSDAEAAVSLRWTWRNAGTRPVHLNCDRCFVEVYDLDHALRLMDEASGVFIDPRQQEKQLASARIGPRHFPFKDWAPFNFEPATSSSVLTVPILPIGRAFLARIRIVADHAYHPAGKNWCYSWERWQVFRTDVRTDLDPSVNLARSQASDSI